MLDTSTSPGKASALTRALMCTASPPMVTVGEERHHPRDIPRPQQRSLLKLRRIEHGKQIIHLLLQGRRALDGVRSAGPAPIKP